MKKVIVISTSLRAGSNSDMLAEKFAEGAKASGNEVEKISLRGKEIKFCVGCLSQGIIYGVIDSKFEDIDVVLGLVNIHLAIFTNPLKLVGIYGVLESAHVICNLSNKHTSHRKNTKRN